MDYSEYLRLFLNINMLAGKSDIKLARIADCIQVNTDFDILKGYTMLAVEAKVAVKTTFMKKVSDLTAGGWNQSGNSYDVTYQSILACGRRSVRRAEGRDSGGDKTVRKDELGVRWNRDFEAGRLTGSGARRPAACCMDIYSAILSSNASHIFSTTFVARFFSSSGA